MQLLPDDRVAVRAAHHDSEQGQRRTGLRCGRVGEDDDRIGADREGRCGGRAASAGRAHWEGEDRAHVLFRCEPNDRLDMPGPVHGGGAAFGDVLARRALGRDELLLTHVVLDHGEPESDLLRAGDRRQSLMDAQHVRVSAGAATRDEHLEPQTGHVLRRVVRRRRRLRRRRERGEHRGGDDDHDEDPGLGHRVADQGGARANPGPQSWTPAQQVERPDRERHQDEDDLHRQRDAVGGLVQIVDEHEPVEGLQHPGRDEQRRRDHRGHRETPDRGAEGSCVFGRVVMAGKEHAPEQRDDTSSPHRGREHVDEVERHNLQAPERGRVRDERRGHRGGDPRRERDHPSRPDGRERTDRHDAAARDRGDRSHHRETRRDRDRREDQARERAHAEHDAQPRRELRPLIDDERERSPDDEHTSDAQKPRLSTRVDPNRRNEEDEERSTQSERDTGVRQRAAGDLEKGRRRRRFRDLGHRRERTVADDEGEVAFRRVAVYRARRSPRHQIPSVRDRIHGDTETVRIARQGDVVLVVPYAIRVQHLDVAASWIRRLAELDPDLRRRLHQTGVGCGIRAHVVRVRLRGAAHQNGTAEDARDDDREASHQRRRMARPPTETSKASAPMTIAAITSVCIESRRAESSAFAATRSGNCSWSVETTPSNVFGPDSKRSSTFVEPASPKR